MLGHNRALARRYGKERTVDAELMEQLPSLGVPTLVIYGENDGLIQLAGLEAMVSHSTASTLRIVKDAAHHVESDQPEQYVELIARFVAQHSRTHLGA